MHIPACLHHSMSNTRDKGKFGNIVRFVLLFLVLQAIPLMSQEMITDILDECVIDSYLIYMRCFAYLQRCNRFTVVRYRSW